MRIKKAGVTAPKNPLLFVLKAATDAPVISGNAVPGMKAAEFLGSLFDKT